jgi:hypothetical protein
MSWITLHGAEREINPAMADSSSGEVVVQFIRKKLLTSLCRNAITRAASLAPPPAQY